MNTQFNFQSNINATKRYYFAHLYEPYRVIIHITSTLYLFHYLHKMAEFALSSSWCCRSIHVYICSKCCLSVVSVWGARLPCNTWVCRGRSDHWNPCVHLPVVKLQFKQIYAILLAVKCATGIQITSLTKGTREAKIGLHAVSWYKYRVLYLTQTVNIGNRYQIHELTGMIRTPVIVILRIAASCIMTFIWGSCMTPKSSHPIFWE